jgi:hypothetical protein
MHLQERVRRHSRVSNNKSTITHMFHTLKQSPITPHLAAILRARELVGKAKPAGRLTLLPSQRTVPIIDPTLVQSRSKIQSRSFVVTLLIGDTIRDILVCRPSRQKLN